jgi:hypothetical protein
MAVVGQTGNTAIQVTESGAASWVVLIALIILFGSAAYVCMARRASSSVARVSCDGWCSLRTRWHWLRLIMAKGVAC